MQIVGKTAPALYGACCSCWRRLYPCHATGNTFMRVRNTFDPWLIPSRIGKTFVKNTVVRAFSMLATTPLPCMHSRLQP